MKNSLLQLLSIFTLSSALILQALCQGSSRNTTTTTYYVLNFGAVGDGSTDDTQVQLHLLFQAFEDAWNATCESRVGSPATMHVPSGSTFLLQPIVFAGPCNSDVNVLIDGTLIAPSDPSEWKCKDDTCSQWITFHNINNLLISGSGTINGQGAQWWDCKASVCVSLSLCIYTQFGGTGGINVRNSSCHIYVSSSTSEYIFFPTPLFLVIRSTFPPNNQCPVQLSCGTKATGFTISDSNNVYISDLTFMDSPKMHIALERSTWVRATNLTITAPENSPNTDGIHVQQSQNVFIEQTLIGTGDDCISIGDGSAYLKISGITCGPGHGISVGSLGFNGANNTVEHVYVSDVVFRGTSNGARIKTWQTSAVEVSNVRYIDIHGTSSGETAVKFACSETVSCTDVSMNDIDLTSNGTSNTTSSCQNVQGTQHEVFPRVPCLTSN
ncbi:hypothetical protein RHMOL_Rhmol10G0042500 [Rhododendron molle]|uniref:Uncharacterized protein n=1 Tax=Rhododendron molle TaxID=49168 RepID=A0ACC0LYT3_RHOML|nr:hypothetical protein RHMOL_Rhmol10G0042500 [Rhododendron molle]